MNVLQSLQKNRFLRYGVPFVTLLVGGSFGLKYFAQVRYMAKERKTMTQADAESMGLLKSKLKEEPATLESEYDRLQKSDLDTWHNIRGPRPWEDSKEVQDQQREEFKQQNPAT